MNGNGNGNGTGERLAVISRWLNVIAVPLITAILGLVIAGHDKLISIGDDVRYVRGQLDDHETRLRTLEREEAAHDSRATNP